MPIREYFCENCGLFEEIQKMSDPSLEKCPKCEGKCEKKFSAPAGFVLKGEGFYRNDYPSADRQAKAGNEPTEKGTGGKLPHPNSLGKSGTIYNDSLDRAPTGPDIQMSKVLKT